MNNPCNECIVRPACTKMCHEFEIYLRRSLPDRWKMWAWDIAGNVKAGRCKLLYFGDHIFKVEGFFI